MLKDILFYYNEFIKLFKISLWMNRLIKKISLQVAIKAINNLAKLDRIIPTLLIFRIYP